MEGSFMRLTLDEFKSDVDKYVDLSRKEDILIIKEGKPALLISNLDPVPWYEKKIPDKVTSIEQLFGTLPSDLTIDDAKIGRLSE